MFCGIFIASSNANALGKDTERVTKIKPQTMPLGIFGSLEFRTNATAGIGEWRRVMAQISSEQALYQQCDNGGAACPIYLAQWRNKIKSLVSGSKNAKLVQINSWVNQHIRYTDDRITFGKSDFWASPAQSLKGRGDCEDYVIAKYTSLLALGFSDTDMRVVIVNDTRKSLGHAVLSVHTTSGNYILDNQNAMPMLDSQISYYAPIYSINASARWINIATRRIKTLDIGSQVAAGSAAAPEKKLAKTLKLSDLRPSFAETDVANFGRSGSGIATTMFAFNIAANLHPSFAQAELEAAGQSSQNIGLSLRSDFLDDRR